MIIEKIIELIINPLLNILPSVSVVVDWSIIDGISNIFYGLNYFLPMNIFITIISAKLSLMIAKCIVAVVVRIKSCIPTMGA